MTMWYSAFSGIATKRGSLPLGTAWRICPVAAFWTPTRRLAADVTPAPTVSPGEARRRKR